MPGNSDGNWRFPAWPSGNTGRRLARWPVDRQFQDAGGGLGRGAQLKDVRCFRMVVGQGVDEDAGELVLRIPEAPPGWQFLFDIIPAQLAAENLSRIAGVDCDSFKNCPYIVRSEYGLITDEVAPEKNADQGQPLGRSGMHVI